MKEVPLAYVRTNQAWMVFAFLLALLFREPWVIVALWAIQIIGLAGGIKRNVLVRLSIPFVRKYVRNGKTEAVELLRFNGTIAVLLLTLSVISFAAGWSTAVYIFAGIVALAAFAAICGYCIGCTMYFQLKQFKARMNR